MQNLNAVLRAAERVLEARRVDMCTVDEWAALARAVAACTGRRTGDLLTERDLEHVAQYGITWDVAADGPLPDAEA